MKTWRSRERIFVLVHQIRRLTRWLQPGTLWLMKDALRLLRLFALVRLPSLISIWLLLREGSVPAGLSAVGVLTMLSLVFVWLPGLPTLGRRLRLIRLLPAGWHLATSLFLLITSQSVELTVTSSTALWTATELQFDQRNWMAIFSWRSESFFYLIVPAVLAAWAFEQRGVLWASTWTVVTYVAGGVWLLSTEGALPMGYLVTLPPKIVLLYAVPSLVAHLTIAQRRQHQALESAHAQLQRQAILAEQLGTSRERNRLARELHDTLAHSLSGLSVQLQVVDVLFDEDATEARERLRAARQMTQKGLNEARRAIAALRASPLEDLGLVEALHRRLEALGERTGIQTAWRVDGYFTDLGPAIEQTVYRVAEEALLNVERHAAAQHVEVDLRRNQESVTLAIRDDGVGFDANANRQDAGHYGLVGMRERAKLIGGRLSIESEPGQGTIVHLSIEE